MFSHKKRRSLDEKEKTTEVKKKFEGPITEIPFGLRRD